MIFLKFTHFCSLSAHVAPYIYCKQNYTASEIIGVNTNEIFAVDYRNLWRKQKVARCCEGAEGKNRANRITRALGILAQSLACLR